MDCRKGGLITQRHNEVRDALGDIAALTYKEVVREPVVRETGETSGIPCGGPENERCVAATV